MRKKSKLTDPTPSGEASGEPSGEPSEEFLSTREARLRLGNISPSKFERLRREFKLEGNTDSFGVIRYSVLAIDELADKLGVAGDDPRDTTIHALQAALKEREIYIIELQKSERQIVQILREENESIRKQRMNDQETFLKYVVATQEALDRTAERRIQVEEYQAKVKMAQEGFEFAKDQLFPVIMQQLVSNTESEKIRKFVHGLSTEHLIALKENFLDAAQWSAIEKLMNETQRKELGEFEAFRATEKADQK